MGTLGGVCRNVFHMVWCVKQMQLHYYVEIHGPEICNIDGHHGTQLETTQIVLLGWSFFVEVLT